MRPAIRRSTLDALVLVVGAALVGSALTGCAAGAPATGSRTPAASSASPGPTDQPATNATESAQPTGTASTPPADPTADGCEHVLTAAALAQLRDDGLEQVEVGVSTYYPIADDLIEAGGVACKWGRPSSDASITVVQLSGIDVAASEWPAALAEAGYAETGDPVAGTYTGPADPGTGVPSAVLVESDRLTFVSAPPFAADIAPAG
ncbi:hypothetical protein BJ978_001138 [Agromyces terreus]|uniref:DUF3558 domain-containing protein n=1 Tax=Agromyces terreus TaxID=424795 RepID=A0A9X2GXK2_9MICO|nr:hypothetical protein [Agromyces terreus]MCP2370462.1 hypothetical protein [Agromyces terreus]